MTQIACLDIDLLWNWSLLESPKIMSMKFGWLVFSRWYIAHWSKCFFVYVYNGLRVGWSWVVHLGPAWRPHLLTYSFLYAIDRALFQDKQPLTCQCDSFLSSRRSTSKSCIPLSTRLAPPAAATCLSSRTYTSTPGSLSESLQRTTLDCWQGPAKKRLV